MRILITGISGFAGTHLAARLLRDGHDVHGTAGGRASIERLRARLGDAVSAIDTVDIADAAAVSAAVRQARPDAVLHLAGTASVGGSARDPASVFAINALGTLHMLAAVRDHCPSARVVTVGSASAYGVIDSSAIPIGEDCVFRPVSPYGVSKAAADLIAHQWAHADGLDIVRVRPFNHIGPGQGLGFVCPDVAQQLVAIERGQRAPVVDVGNVDVVRDFTDVRDVVDGYIAALEHGARAAVYNVCSGVGQSVRAVIARLIALSGTNAEMRVAPERQRAADVPVAIGSPARLHEVSGWSARIPLEQTLADILADWRTRRAAS